MRYIVERTGYDSKVKPCEEAYLDVHYVLERFTGSEEEYNLKHQYVNKKWSDMGTAHQTTKEGWITRRVFKKERWTLKIDSLELLMKFIDKYAQVIISNGHGETETPILEIYDDWRE